MGLRALTPAEGRVLGVLVEKQHTVPDTYPLSLNALLAGCNQKTARQPVMELGEGDVLAATEGLKQLHLLFEVSGSRVLRYEHNLPRGIGVPSQSAALLATLLLRGPQTAAELRLNSDRLHHFADVSSVDAFLDELAASDPPKVVKLARAPGEREARWAQLLCGEPPQSTGPRVVASLAGETPGELAWLSSEVIRLTTELGALRAELETVKRELGMSPSQGGSDAV